MTKNFIAKDKEIGQRIDIVLAKRFPEYSRSYFCGLIKSAEIKVNDVDVKSSYKVAHEDKLSVNFAQRGLSPKLEAEDIDLNVIYEDDHILVIDKPSNLVVHPAAGNWSGTLVNALLHYLPKNKLPVYKEGDAVSESRPGLIHRLDKDTSGVLIVAKDMETMLSLSNQIKNRKVEKIYTALCFNWPKNNSGTLENLLGRDTKDRKKIAVFNSEKGRLAISKYRVLKYLDFNNFKCSLIEFNILTGRTHQIRVQAKFAGFPVLGDHTYFTKESAQVSLVLGLSRQMLHASSISIILPHEKDAHTFSAPLPQDFLVALNKFKEI